MATAPQSPYTVATVPPDVYQAASAAQLGEAPQRELHAKTSVSKIILGIILLAGGLAFLLGPTLGGAGQDSGTNVAIFAVVGLVMLAGALYTLLYGLIFKNWGVFV